MTEDSISEFYTSLSTASTLFYIQLSLVIHTNGKELSYRAKKMCYSMIWNALQYSHLYMTFYHLIEIHKASNEMAYTF